jgi:hypothetical protein
MEFGATYHLEDSQQFWAGVSVAWVFWSGGSCELTGHRLSELDDIVSVNPHGELRSIDYALRSYVTFAAHYYGTYPSLRIFLAIC